MPQFEQPAWLMLLPFVVMVLVWWLRRKPLVITFPHTSGLEAINSRRGFFSRWGGAILRGLALGAAVVALAGPRWPDPGAHIRTQGVAILLVVDVSNSMNEEDAAWNGKPAARITAVKRALRLFVEGGAGPQGLSFPGRSDDLIGLITFTRRPKTSCPLTLSHEALLRILDAEETNKGGHDFDTNVGDAIAWGVDRLNTSPVEHKVMVLVTDGEQGEIPQALRPRQGAQLAAPFDITIMVVDPGNDAVVESKIAADQFAAQNRVNAKKALQDVAKMTGGRYFAARDSATLLDACSELGKQLDLLEREATGTLHRRQYLEGYAWFAAAAFVLICGVMALDLMIWRRVP